MPWRMFYCPNCGNWQASYNGKWCLKCNSAVEETDYTEENFPCSEENVGGDSPGNGLNEQVKKNLKNEKVTSKMERDERLYVEIRKMSEDIQFIANVFRAYILISVIVAIILFIVYMSK